MMYFFEKYTCRNNTRDKFNDVEWIYVVLESLNEIQNIVRFIYRILEFHIHQLQLHNPD